MSLAKQVLEQCAQVESGLRTLRDLAQTESDPQRRQQQFARADEMERLMREAREFATNLSEPPPASRNTVTLRGLAISLTLMGIYTAAHLSFQHLLGLSAAAATALTLGLVVLVVAALLAIFYFGVPSRARLDRSREELAELDASVRTIEALLSQVPQIIEAENNPAARQSRKVRSGSH
jgi:Flp pilus assembly protein TadB